MKFNSKTQEWVDALRSGDYHQGRGALYTPKNAITNGYCCLGVAAECLFDWDDLDHGESTLNDDQADALGFEDMTSAVYDLTPEDRLFYEKHKILIILRDQSSLIKLNDTHKWTFDQIADLVESTKEDRWAIVKTEAPLTLEPLA